ncbi:MAG: cytochrome [Actinomycetia bacterium]|nr:cytochrome [Actinomycetes bacterium]
MLLNAGDPALQADPFPLYRRLREESPVVELDDGTWLVTRHADVSALLRNRSISSAQVGGDPGGPVAELEVNGRNLMIASDPPVHTRRRGAVAPRFTVQPVQALRPAIEAHVAHRLDEVVARLAADGEVDLVPTFCARIPMDTLCSLLGLPLEDEDRLRRWTTDLIDGVDPWAGPDAAVRAGAALAEVCPYLDRFLAERRRTPTDDLLSTLATAPDLTPDEQLHNAVLFLNAGLDTSGDLVANALGLLLDTPGAWAALVADPERIAPMAVEEAARFDSPVQVSMRRTIDPVTVGHVVIPRGRPLLLGLGAANRDPEVFDEPDRFVVERDDRRHVAFGGGAHLCLGAPIARLEVATALVALARRLPDLARVGESGWRPRLAFRGRASLVVTA